MSETDQVPYAGLFAGVDVVNPLKTFGVVVGLGRVTHFDMVLSPCDV